MHALMGKSSKAPTPQELYRARKQKEEQERAAFLPPGFINHGNTCFMNSVLQGLLATPMLADIVRFSLPDTYAPVLSRRSPQLTNGHGLAGESEQEWVQGMPLGDAFVYLMSKAWAAQDERQRLSMTPKELLTRIGAKFDQYLDFRQQDAHEFLRHLLDAMRMEELDIIKVRQPPPPKSKRKRKIKAEDIIPEEDQLVSFVDMVFGGRLASILVCEKCKKVSCTYEDFNDLSLSIKQEDYEKARKRDRLKSLARKLGMRGRGAVRELDIPEGPRSSSVPASPMRRSEEPEHSFELVIGTAGQRRRSLEAGEETPSSVTAFREEVKEEVVVEGKKKDERKSLGVVDGQSTPDGETDTRQERDKEEDGWVKLRRKISVGMGVKRGSRSRKKSSKEAPMDSVIDEENQIDTRGEETVDSFVDVKAPSPLPISPAASPMLNASNSMGLFSFARRTSSSRIETPSASGSPALSALASPSRSPDIPPIALPVPKLRASSPSLSPSPSPAPAEPVRPKSPRPPKPTRSESAYLRRILADIPASSSASSSVSFNLFNALAEVSDARGVWPKSGQVQSVEGCLKMFTSVEVLDGENMVGCRRCWKIQRGEYVPREQRARKRGEEEADGNDDGDDDDDDDDEENEEGSDNGSNSSASVKIKLVNGDDSTPVDVLNDAHNPRLSSLDSDDHYSVRSAPPLSSIPDESDEAQRIPFPTATTASSPALSVPSISMTAPLQDSESESTPPATEEKPVVEVPQRETSANIGLGLITSSSRDSLQLPSRHSRQAAERGTTSDTSSLSSDDSGSETETETETETSLTASMRSDTSSASVASESGTSKAKSPSIRNASLSSNTAGIPQTKSNGNVPKAVPRAKQVEMRRAYKRYLIATPPPVLVVHLKRFQQVGRAQFIANFKKLDDPVSYAEYLDLKPFLLPNKEEIKEEKKKAKRDKVDDALENGVKKTGFGAEECMYRLCAVVVHIGNMLGGHYVAYTALPDFVLPSSSASISSETKVETSSNSSLNPDSLRPQNPRTTSFTQTADPHPASKSRTSSSGKFPQRQWCYVSDTIVRLASLEEVLQAKAYICMYERI